MIRRMSLPESRCQPVWKAKIYGPRHGCNGRGGALRGAGARREGPRPAAGRRRRRAASSGRRPVRRGSPRGGDHFPGLGRRAASKGRRATLQTALLRCAAGSSVSPTARHAARRIIEGAWTLSGALFFLWCNCWCESVTYGGHGARRDGTAFFSRRLLRTG